MGLLTFNFKEMVLSSEDTQSYVELCIDYAKQEKTFAFKIIHGYGSHNRGGAIFLELKKCLPQLKKRGVIKGYVLGPSFNMACKCVLENLEKSKEMALDEDFNKQNPGITIILL